MFIIKKANDLFFMCETFFMLHVKFMDNLPKVTHIVVIKKIGDSVFDQLLLFGDHDDQLFNSATKQIIYHK